jgi:hypothetical protein
MHFSGPIFGGRNGSWQRTDPAGNRVPFSGSSNPYSQVLNQAYALSDEMNNYRHTNPLVPDAINGQFFKNFNSYVAIAPRIHPESKVTKGALLRTTPSIASGERATFPVGRSKTGTTSRSAIWACDPSVRRKRSIREPSKPRTLSSNIANVLEA